MKIRRERLRQLERELQRRDRKLRALAEALDEARRRADAHEQAARRMQLGLHAVLVRTALGMGTEVKDGDRVIGRRLRLPPVRDAERWCVKGWTEPSGVSWLGVGLADDPADAAP